MATRQEMTLAQEALTPMGNKDRVYKVTIKGTYHGNRNGQKTQSNYIIDLYMDEAARQLRFLSPARNHLLARALKAKYPDYKRFRTHEVVRVIDMTNGGKQVLELDLMDRDQIVSYVKKKGWPIITPLYPELTDLRRAIRDYNENRQAFVELQEKRRLTLGPELQMITRLNELNPSIDDTSFTDAEFLASQLKSLPNHNSEEAEQSYADVLNSELIDVKPVLKPELTLESALESTLEPTPDAAPLYKKYAPDVKKKDVVLLEDGGMIEYDDGPEPMVQDPKPEWKVDPDEVDAAPSVPEFDEPEEVRKFLRDV